MSVPVIIESGDDAAAGTRRAHAVFGTILTVGLILVLALAPLPMGSVYPWAW